MKKVPELLAPAGDLTCLKAAVSAGCDAVYFGGQAFNARQGAGNFTIDEIREAIAFCGIHGVKTHLTLNTMVKEKEWPFLCTYLDEILPYGIDAVIVQDLGVARLLHARYPQVELHASTQMAVHDAEGVRFLERLGFSRAVLARELSLAEIRAIRSETSMELEVFIHGALCCSYSGRCLLSSFHGGRSGNRGTCAQPCRLPYRVDGRRMYPMNLKDLCAADSLQALAEAGVDSVKIEGRMKGSAYVTGVVQTYRGLLDALRQTEGTVPPLSEEAKNRLKQLYNRGGFTDGYLVNQKEKMLAGDTPKHQGIEIGAVQAVRGAEVLLTVRTEVAPGDVLEIHTDHRPYPDFRIGTEMIREHTIRFKTDQSVRVGQKVYRLIDVRLNERLQEEAQKVPKIGIRMALAAKVGQTLSLKATAREKSVTAEGPIVEEAKTKALTKEEAARQLERVGGTDYTIEAMDIEIDENAFVPVSVLNQLRREAIECLSQALVPSLRMQMPLAKSLTKSLTLPWEDPTPIEGSNTERQVGVHTKEQWWAVLEYGETVDVLLPTLELFDAELLRESRKRGLRVIPQEVPISRPKDRAWYRQTKKAWRAAGITEFEVQHLGEVMDCVEAGDAYRAGFFLAVMNRAGASFWQQQGAESFFLSAELTGTELRPLQNLQGATVLIYGKIPLMVTEQCFYRERYGCEPNPAGHTVKLEDRYQTILCAKSHCASCYTILYEDIPLWLGDRALRGVNRRLELTEEDETETKKVFEALSDRAKLSRSQRGHFEHGVQ